MASCKPEIHEVSVNAFPLIPANIDSRLSVNFWRFVGIFRLKAYVLMKVITVNRSTALVNCELNLSLSYIILLSLFHAKTFSFREVSLVLDGRGLYG